MKTTMVVDGLRVHLVNKVASTTICNALHPADPVYVSPLDICKKETRWIVVRHPLDRLVSNWAFFCRSETDKNILPQQSLIKAGCYLGMPFDEFLGVILPDIGVNKHTWQQIHYAGPHRFDRICRLENLALEWASLRSRFPRVESLGFLNKSDHDDWQGYYTTIQRKTAELVYAADMALFEASDPNPP